MFIFNHKLNGEYAFTKFLTKFNDIEKNENEVLRKEAEESEKVISDKLEDFIIMLPLIIILLGIIIMSIIYKIFT